MAGVAAVAALGMLSGGVAYAHSTGGSGDGTTKVVDAGRRAHGVRGTVAAIDGTTFVVTKRDGTGVTVTTSDTTAFSVTEIATVADAVVGSYVVVHGKTGDDGTLSAGWLAIKPPPADPADPAGKWHWRHGVAGEVTANDPATGILTLTTPDGPVTVATTAETKVLKTTAGTIANLTVGALVGVHGTFAEDGTLAADRVKVLPAGAITPAPVQPVAQPVVTTTTVVVDPTATTSAPTTAAPEPEKTDVRGTVLSVAGEAFTLTTKDGSTVSVLTNADTTFSAKECDGRDGDDGDDGDATASSVLGAAVASLTDVVVGAEVKVVGTLGTDGTLVASQVIVGAGDDGAHGGQRDGEHEDHDGDGTDQSWASGDRGRHRSGSQSDGGGDWSGSGRDGSSGED